MRRILPPLLALLAALPAAAAPGGKALLFVGPEQKAALAGEARRQGATVRELPGALELDAAIAAGLAGRALRYELLPDPFKVELATGQIDLRSRRLDLAKVPEAVPVPLIVAWDGVPDAGFVGRLAATGAIPVGSLPPSAYLVRADAAAARRLADLPQVAALGALAPAYKIAPRLAEEPEAAEAEIVLFEGAGGDEVQAMLEEMGIEFTSEKVDGRVIVFATLPADARDKVAGLPAVEAIDAGAEAQLYNNEVRVVMQTDKTHYLGNQGFYNPVYAIGVWGASQVVTAADTGLDPHEVFNAAGKVISNVVAGSCVTVAADTANHGTGVAATLLGDKISASAVFGTANDLDGLSLRSRLMMQDIEEGGSLCPFNDYVGTLFKPALAAGSRVHTNSWGHNALPNSPMAGSYSWRSQMIDKYLSQPGNREQSVLFAAGNAGWKWPPLSGYQAFTLSDEAHSKNAVVVGGSQNGDNRDRMYRYSSRGPTNDCQGVACGVTPQRVKPDVVAPADLRVDTADNWTPTSYSNFSGTSIAAPAVAGAAAMIRDYFAQGKYPNDPTDPPLGGPPSSALVKAMLVNATVPLYDSSAYLGNLAQGLAANAYPNYDQGYGRPVLDNVLEPAGYRKLKVFEDATTVSRTGDLWTRTLTIPQAWGATCNNLRVTLAWNDPAATLAAGLKLVDNLDLEVIFNGVTARGNHRLTGGGWDKVNNVEDVFLPQGYFAPFSLHTLTIRVYGRNVPAGRQPWALVLTYGACSDNVPCPPPPVGPGCYRGPGDVVPGSTWLPPLPGCFTQIYHLTEYNASVPRYPFCADPTPQPVPTAPVPTPPAPLP